MTRSTIILALRVCVLLALAFWYSAEAFLLVPVALMMPPSLLDACTIFSDDFSTDQLATAYSTRSGSFSVSGGNLRTTSNGALLRCETAGTTGHGHVYYTGSADTAAAVLICGGSYVDDNNYVYAKLTINGVGSTFELFKVSGGTTTQLGSTFTVTTNTNTNYVISCCWNGTIAIGGVTGASGLIRSIAAAYTGTGNQAIIGGSANGGTILFDDLNFQKHLDDDSTCAACAGETCGNCDTGTTPVAYSVTISGVVNVGGGPCNVGECASTFNKTFILDAPSVFFATNNCRFSYSISGSSVHCCYYGLELIIGASGSYTFKILLDPSNPAQCSGWTDQTFTPGGTISTNCLLSSQQFNTRTSGTDTHCDFSAATISISAIP